MPLQIIRNDITKMPVDAIVNAAKNSLLGGGGVDGQIHAAAGPELLAECRTLGGCKTGDAKITAGYNLPAKHVIHTVGPVWHGGGNNEESLLRSCYIRSLQVAAENSCESVAFPLISSGIYGYPKTAALRVAVDAISSWLAESEDILVYIVIFDRDSFSAGGKLYLDIYSYIDDVYADDTIEKWQRRREEPDVPQLLKKRVITNTACESAAPERNSAIMATGHKTHFYDMDEYAPVPKATAMPPLEEYIKNTDENFSAMLLRLIDEKGITDAQCYKKANIDRKHFSKIRNDANYRPKKSTVLAFAIALELTLAETDRLLKSAGYALSHSSKSDIVVEYFILKRIYNIHEINIALFDFDLPLLGA